MFKRTALLLLTSMFLAGCATGPEGYLKKSANNKLFDMKGFKGGKRTPLYNKKYIKQAKKNVDSDLYDDDEFLFDPESEEENIALANREMYREMIRKERDMRHGKSKRKSWSLFSQKKSDYDYPVTTQASHIIRNNDRDKEDLREELDEIKSMLEETRRDFASYNCPTASDLNGQYRSERGRIESAKQKSKESMITDHDDENIGTEIIDPVHSI